MFAAEVICSNAIWQNLCHGYIATGILFKLHISNVIVHSNQASINQAVVCIIIQSLQIELLHSTLATRSFGILIFSSVTQRTNSHGCIIKESHCLTSIISINVSSQLSFFGSNIACFECL